VIDSLRYVGLSRQYSAQGRDVRPAAASCSRWSCRMPPPELGPRTWT